MHISIPPSVETELLAILDKALDSESGVIFYSCTDKRADYLKRMGEALKTETTISAVKMSDGEFLGSYCNIRLLATTEGLYAARTSEPALNASQIILVAAYSGRYFTIECEDELAAAARVSRLKTATHRLRKKYKDQELDRVQINIAPNNPTLVRVGVDASTRNALHEIPSNQVDEILSRMSSAESIDDPDDF